MLKAVNLDLIKNTQKGNLYSSSGKELFFLKPCDRLFEGKPKKPQYYISKIDGQKSVYLTGLFATENQNIFSGDTKDQLGVKIIYLFEFSEAGKKLKIYPKNGGR